MTVFTHVSGIKSETVIISNHITHFELNEDAEGIERVVMFVTSGEQIEVR